MKERATINTFNNFYRPYGRRRGVEDLCFAWFMLFVVGGFIHRALAQFSYSFRVDNTDFRLIDVPFGNDKQSAVYLNLKSSIQSGVDCGKVSPSNFSEGGVLAWEGASVADLNMRFSQMAPATINRLLIVLLINSSLNPLCPLKMKFVYQVSYGSVYQ